MAKAKPTPLLDTQRRWVSWPVRCPSCGESMVDFLVRTDRETSLALICPVCSEPTGQTVKEPAS